MLITKPRSSPPAAHEATPYELRLRALAVMGELGREVAGSLTAMIGCVERGAYGRMRTLFRALPMSCRHQLGVPPACREHDVHERLEW